MAKKALSPQTKLPTLIVGIGASSGGINALRKLLARIGEPQEIAFVVIRHLDESGTNLSHEALVHSTKMPVVEITEGVALKGGLVYHSSSHSTVSLEKGIFKVEHAIKRTEQFSVIDAFFRSLAKDQGQRAVAVILSGDGSDGAQGLKTVGDSGGMTLAQLIESAESPSMPQNAVGTGAVDHILLPEEMPAEILSYSKYLAKLLKKGGNDSIHEEITSALIEICEILHKATRHDFKHYKTSTLVRRIQRRMQVLQIADVHAYVEKLHVDFKEVDSLFKELLINVTSFFRDKEAFETLKEEVLMKALKARKPDQKYRVWVAGCSTGEEVYTLAILIREILAKMNEPPEVQIIATDIDEHALNQARKGIYPITIAEHVSAARLKKFFVRKGGKYVVNKELREIVLFSSHNLINDPPFSQLDLISCRNVLIYLGPHLQKKLIPVFHYALRPGGCLFLGTSESLTGHKELFRTVSVKHRIAQRKATSIRPPGFSTTLSHAYVSHTSGSNRNHEVDVHLVSQRIVLDEFAPKYAVVNDEGHIVSVSSGIAQYFDPSEGTFQNNLMKMVKPSLRVGLRSAFGEAKKQKRKVTHQDSTLKFEHDFARIGITVQPMPQLGDEEALYMVVFHYFGTLAKKDVRETGDSQIDPSVVDQLERELSTLRGDLDRSVQDLEASNEELKSSNEELLSMNEELQSANEELETSKEEVQSANDALQRSNNDLENLLASTEIATLFLDKDMNIQSFTPQLELIYNVVRGDVGRPIGHLTSLAKTMPAYPKIVDGTFTSGVIEIDIEMQNNRWVLRRISPYRTAEGTYSGIVVTFIDVTHLRVAQERYRHLADSMPQIVWTADPDGRVDYFNERWFEYTDFPRGGQMSTWEPILHPEDRRRTTEAWEKSVRTGAYFEMEFRLRDRKTQNYRWFMGRAIAARNSNGQITKWYGSINDIDNRVNSTQENERRLERTIRRSPSFMCTLAGPTLVFEQANQKYMQLVGHRDIIGKTIADALPEVVDQGFVDLLKTVMETGEDYVGTEVPVFLQRAPGAEPEKRFLDFVYQADEPVNGKVQRLIVHGNDVTDKVIARTIMESAKLAIENERENFRSLFRQTPEMVCILSGPEHRFEFVNEAHVRVLGFDATEMTVREAQPESVEIHGILDEVFRTGVTAELHEIPITVGKKLRYFNLTYAARRNDDGQINGVMILGTEMTGEVEIREEINQVKERYKILFDYSPLPKWIFDPQTFQFLDVNETALRIYGYSRQEFLSMKLIDIRPQEDREKFRLSQDLPFKLGNVGFFRDFRHYKKDRTLVDVEVSTVDIMFNGQPARMSAMVDVSDRKHAERDQKALLDRLQSAKDDAERANESKTLFLANMSHEIRTPLAAILGFSELLHGHTESGNSEAAGQLERISRNAAQLGRLIDELLDLSKIEAEKFEIDRADFDLMAAVDDALSTVVNRAREKGLTFEQRSIGPVPRMINTDPTRFRQILTNVIGNAVKFTEEGRIEAELEMFSTDNKNFLRIRVKDTGIGLSPEQQSKIFERFVQADPSVTRKYGGTGLGLVLSKRLARLMGGDLLLEESALGKGSSFVVTIEIGEAKSASAPAKKIAATPSDLQGQLLGKNILVVDDSPDNQMIIRLFLKSQGATIDLANNGLEGVEKMKERSYDVVIMDIQMPVMDGYQALRVANQNGYRGPIIALTAHALKEEKDRCLAAGFTEYLSKPIDRPLLIRRLVELLQKN